MRLRCPLSAVLYELMTLRKPFECQHIAATVMRIIEAPPHKVPPSVKNQYSDEMWDIVYAMLQKDPDKRPFLDEILSRPSVQHQLTLWRRKIERHIAVSIHTPPHTINNCCASCHCHIPSISTTL